MMFETEQEAQVITSEYVHFCSGIFHDAQLVVTYSEVGLGSYAIFLADPKTDRPFMYLGAVTDSLLFLPSAELPVDRVFSTLLDAICYLLSIYGVDYLGSV